MKGVALFILALFFLASCTTPESTRIGVLLPLSGTSNDAGESAQQGFTLAQEDLAAQGIAVTLIYEDTQYNPQQAATAATKLITVDGVKFLLGAHGSSQSLAIASIAKAYEVVQVVHASQAAQITREGERIFRTSFTTASEADYWAGLLAAEAPTLGILYLNTDYGVSYVDAFVPKYEAAGGNALVVEAFDSGQVDYRNLILRLKESGATAALIIGARKHGGLILVQAEELDYHPAWYASSVIEGHQFLEVAGDLAEGVIYPTAYDPDLSEKTRAFAGRYMQRFGREPDFFSASAYDALMLLGECIDEHAGVVTGVQQCLYDVDYDGVSGKFSIDEHGDAQRSFVLKTVRDGAFVKLEE